MAAAKTSRRETAAGDLIRINPYAVGGSFLDYCIRQGWIVREGKGRSAGYFATPAGAGALKAFGIRASDILPYPSPVRNINADWHRAHPMPKNPSPEDRLLWHGAHAAACACRPIPAALKAEIGRRQKNRRARKAGENS
jgi:hypothetical protein